MHNENEYTRIGEMIKGERLKHRISLRDFCRTVCVDSSYMSQLERGVINYDEGGLPLIIMSDALKLETKESRQQLFDLSLKSNLVDQPHELLMPFPHKAIKSHSDKIKILAILNIERLDNKAYRDEICETLTTFEQEVLFEYFSVKLNDLKNEFKAYKQVHN